MTKSAILVLEDGSVYEGHSFGAVEEAEADSNKNSGILYVEALISAKQLISVQPLAEYLNKPE